MASQTEGPAATRKLSHGEILKEWEQFVLKNHLNLKQVIPTLVQRQVLSARVGSALEASPRKFLGFLKKKSVEDFASFCEAVAESFPMNEEHVKLVSLMSGSLERLDVPQGSETFTRVQRVIKEARNFSFGTPTTVDTAPPPVVSSLDPVSAHQADASTEQDVVQEPVVMPTDQSAEQLQSVPSELPLGSSLEPVVGSSTEAEQVQSPLSSSLTPPKGHIHPARSQHFRREEGGILYCSAHDVKLSIPPFASPSDIPDFVISMHVYVEGPFDISDDVELCMPVIWLGLYPQFTFEKPVTLKLQHSAIIDDDADDYVLLRASEDPNSDTYNFTEELEADFSDGYHAVVELGHFCAVTGGRRRKRSSQRRKRTGSKGRLYKKGSSESRRTQSGTPELRKQTTPELVRLLSSTSSAAVSPQSSLASTSLSFEGSFESPLPNSSVYSHAHPSQNYSCSDDQSVHQFAADAMDGPIRNPSQACQTGFQGQYGRSLPYPTTSQSHSQPNASSSDPNTRGQRRSGMRRQQAFDEGGGQWVLATQQSSGEGNSSCNYLTMAMCTAREENEERWSVAFLASLCHPTGILALNQACKEMEMKTTTLFRPVSDCLVFEPQSWENGGWRGQTISNARIGVDKVSKVPFHTEEQRDIMAPIYPPRVTYNVRGVGVCSNYLEQRINVKGADVDGEELFFQLVLKSPQSSGRTASSRKLNTWPELYSQSSTISETLSSNGCTCNLMLDPCEPDHIKLLADLSFQLTRKDVDRLPNLLAIDEAKKDRIMAATPNDLAEHAFQFLLSWVASHNCHGSSSWNELFSILQTLGISGVDLDSSTNVGGTAVHQHVISDNDYYFIAQLCWKLGPRWKFVGRFLGLSTIVIGQCEAIHGNDSEAASQMLLSWRREAGNEATYGALFRALHRMLKYESPEICGAYSYVRKHIMNRGNLLIDL